MNKLAFRPPRLDRLSKTSVRFPPPIPGQCAATASLEKQLAVKQLPRIAGNPTRFPVFPPLGETRKVIARALGTTQHGPRRALWPTPRNARIRTARARSAKENIAARRAKRSKKLLTSTAAATIPAARAGRTSAAGRPKICQRQRSLLLLLLPR